jgi:Na+:H+ antiporter, NhaA family
MDDSRGNNGPRLIPGPLYRFLQTEAASGALLLLATIVALAWANSPWSGSYASLWHTKLGFDQGNLHLTEDLRHWVNDGLMTLFFFVVGLEIKRELIDGELTDGKKAALPACAALGGMVIPAAIFLAFNAGGNGSGGWGIPMATDIAFAVGVLAVVGKALPTSLRVFLLSLAIVDDIGAIIVIAIFYSTGISFAWLAAAAGGLVVIALLNRVGVTRIWIYASLGVLVWLATFQSGIHATIAGVALGLMTPADPAETDSPAERIEVALHPFTSFLIVPLFAFANAGVALNADVITAALSSRVTLGVFFGLVIGKLVGVSLFAWLAVRLRIGTMPEDSTWPHIIGVAAVAGIGFTVSLFIAGLAFSQDAIVDEAKVGILAGSLAATILGAVLLKSSGADDEVVSHTVHD